MNSSLVVALCTTASAFSENQILRAEVAKRYPGALWMPKLADKLLQRGIRTLTGDIALRQIRQGQLAPHDVLVIKEDLCTQADELIGLGAKGKIMLCCESPLFAANFYRNLASTSTSFEYCVVFRGALKDTFPKVASQTLYFPSFERSDLRNVLPWQTRKYLVMVAGNKYWKIRRSKIRNIIATIRDLLLRRPVRFSKEHSSSQLHDERLAAISYFGKTGTLDLYGSDWSNLSNLPLRWQRELSTLIPLLNPKECNDKLATIANYKFALCFENIEFPGYVTEKIIDCLAAKVVPIYWGAPDILEFIPETCFIDGRRFRSFEELETHLKNISEQAWVNIIRHGSEFLESIDGHRYSHTGFAEQVEEMLIR
jgi:hypothetical protein